MADSLARGGAARRTAPLARRPPRSYRNAPMSAPARPSLLRSAIVGLSLAGFIAGLAFMITSVYSLVVGVDCAQLSSSECALEKQLAASIGRSQLWLGLALSLLSVAGFLWLRAGRRAPSDGNEESNA
jgi:hypothetical protein